MSAECHVCGYDLPFDLECRVCSLRARVAELEGAIAAQDHDDPPRAPEVKCKNACSTIGHEDRAALVEVDLTAVGASGWTPFCGSCATDLGRNHDPMPTRPISSSGQFCALHNIHQDHPDHGYSYPECERHLRDATLAEEATVYPVVGVSRDTIAEAMHAADFSGAQWWQCPELTRKAYYKRADAVLAVLPVGGGEHAREALTEPLAEALYDAWRQGRRTPGAFQPERWDELPDARREYDRALAREVLAALPETKEKP